MDGFDSEIERAVNRAGRTAFGLNLIALILVALTLLALIAPSNMGPLNPGAAEIFFGLMAAGVFHALAMLIHLNGMQLMEVWRQGRRSDT
jgi:EamA domain-containing membrane protein RarD